MTSPRRKPLQAFGDSATAFTGLAGAFRELNLFRKTKELRKRKFEIRSASATCGRASRESFRPNRINVDQR
jgi:hypothetical protein